MPPLAAAVPESKPAAAAKAPAQQKGAGKKTVADARAAVAPADKPAAAGGARVAGTIALSDQLRGKVAPGDTVVIRHGYRYIIVIPEEVVGNHIDFGQ